MAPEPRASLRLIDLSDREFLLILADLIEEGGEGWVDSADIAIRLDLTERKVASSRLSWLARWGAVEREHRQDDRGNIRYHRNGKVMHTQRWRLTSIGWQLASGDIRKGTRAALEKADDGQMLLITRWLATRESGATTQKLMSREWQREQLLRK